MSPLGKAFSISGNLHFTAVFWQEKLVAREPPSLSGLPVQIDLSWLHPLTVFLKRVYMFPWNVILWIGTSGSPLLRRVHSFPNHEIWAPIGLLVRGVQSALKSTDSVYTVGNSQQIRGGHTPGGSFEATRSDCKIVTVLKLLIPAFTNNTNCWWWRNGNSHTLLMRMWSCTTSSEKRLSVPWKLSRHPPYDSVIPFLRFYSR